MRCAGATRPRATPPPRRTPTRRSPSRACCAPLSGRRHATRPGWGCATLRRCRCRRAGRARRRQPSMWRGCWTRAWHRSLGTSARWPLAHACRAKARGARPRQWSGQPWVPPVARRTTRGRLVSVRGRGPRSAVSARGTASSHTHERHLRHARVLHNHTSPRCARQRGTGTPAATRTGVRDIAAHKAHMTHNHGTGTDEHEEAKQRAPRHREARAVSMATYVPL